MTPIFGGFRAVATTRELFEVVANGHLVAASWLFVVLRPHGLFARAKQRK
ncbi:MAG: hypothetical protein RL243_538 [Actinomycetota bacterium]